MDDLGKFARRERNIYTAVCVCVLLAQTQHAAVSCIVNQTKDF